MKRYLLLLPVLAGCGGGGTGAPSLKTLNGPWTYYDTQDEPQLVMRFDGAGSWQPVGMFDAGSGTYTVDADGRVSIQHPQWAVPLNGRLNDARDSITLDLGGHVDRISDTASLAGTWSGTLWDTQAQVVATVVFTVNPRGEVTSVTGIDGFQEGYAFAVAGSEGTVVLIYWRFDKPEDDSFNEVYLTGVLTGSSQAGAYLLDDPDGNTDSDGTFLFGLM